MWSVLCKHPPSPVLPLGNWRNKIHFINASFKPQGGDPMQTTTLLPLLKRKPTGYKIDEFALTKRKTLASVFHTTRFQNWEGRRESWIRYYNTSHTTNIIYHPPTLTDVGKRAIPLSQLHRHCPITGGDSVGKWTMVFMMEFLGNRLFVVQFVLMLSALTHEVNHSAIGSFFSHQPGRWRHGLCSRSC